MQSVLLLVVYERYDSKDGNGRIVPTEITDTARYYSVYSWRLYWRWDV